MSKSSRLEQEIVVLRHELALMRCDRDELYHQHAPHLRHCSGGDNCKKMHMAEADTNQDLYISYLEDQIQKTRKKYQKQMADVKSSATMLEKKLQKVRRDMNCITAKVREVEKLRKNVQILKSKVQRRDTIIARYTNNASMTQTGNDKNFDQPSSDESGPNHIVGVISTTDPIQDDGWNNDMKEIESESKSSLNFSCLTAALRNKMVRSSEN